MELPTKQVFERLAVDQIVDVRETEELAEGMIPGARHIPLSDLPHSHHLFDAARPVIAVCRSGRRSAIAAENLAAAGFTAHTMTGGMLEWTSEALPTVVPHPS